jgi:hypothetical protein
MEATCGGWDFRETTQPSIISDREGFQKRGVNVGLNLSSKRYGERGKVGHKKVGEKEI